MCVLAKSQEYLWVVQAPPGNNFTVALFGRDSCVVRWSARLTV